MTRQQAYELLVSARCFCLVRNPDMSAWEELCEVITSLFLAAHAEGFPLETISEDRNQALLARHQYVHSLERTVARGY